jgi:16S rRNA (guanine(527)-N(7))-methyltransferase RsmG
MREEFVAAVKANEGAFGLTLTDVMVDLLASYYDSVRQHNDLLHLVGPSSPAEFAVRHVLESLTLLEYLPRDVTFADIGPGAGLPSIPCLLVRDDLKAVLIESKEKKAGFLAECASALGISGRATIVNRQFAETEPGRAEFITCRALDRFTDHLPRLLKWARKRTLLLFGGDNLGEALKREGAEPTRSLMPLSERRYLFICRGS